MNAPPRTMAVHRRAFTLIEMLVVVVIIGVLIFMLLPAIQAAREAVRRASCTNNLTQLIVAIHNYEHAHRVYPAGTIDAAGPIVNVPAPGSYHHAWTTQILPYIGERNAAQTIDRTVGVYHPRNALLVTGRGAMPHIFQCVSGTTPPSLNLSDYAACHNDAEKPIDAIDNGMFVLNAFLQRDDLLDGATNTIFLGEKLADAWDQHWLSGTRATLRNMGTPINGLNFDNGLPKPQWPDWNSDPYSLPSAGEDEDTSDQDSEAEIAPGPAARVASGIAAAPGNPLYVGGFGSRHNNGAQFAMGDGSVRFLKDNLSPAVAAQLANRADGSLPSRNW